MVYVSCSFIILQHLDFNRSFSVRCIIKKGRERKQLINATPLDNIRNPSAPHIFPIREEKESNLLIIIYRCEVGREIIIHESNYIHHVCFC